MTNIVEFGFRGPSKKKTEAVIPVQETKNLHITEGEEYDLETVAIGVEIALHITHDYEAADFLVKKFLQAVNQRSIFIYFDLDVRRKYLDYLDIQKSQHNKDLRNQVGKYKYE
jgi:hypothetical protein